MSQPQYSAPMAMPQKSKGFPWLLFGCGCLFAIVALVVVLSITAYVLVKDVVETYSEPAPKDIPVSTATPEEFQAVDARIKTFVAAVKQGTPVGPLVLTGDDINAVIANDPEWAPMKGRLHVTIEGDKMTAETSIPLDAIGFSGRYFNGAVTLSSRMENGKLHIHIESAEMNGKAAPEQVMGAWRAQNLADEMNNNPDIRPALEAMESIEVKDSTVIFTPKKKL
ncbi:MAG: hypothetical protein K1Y02_01235 [Candidatus Hydrogenedentes bacterium]|nr:hypothetical protein [Candidatus Hydrogenedentota bacterium]